MMLAAISVLLAAMSSADAVAIVLNSKNAIGARTFREAREQVERDAAAGKPLQQFVVGVTTDNEGLRKSYLAASRTRIVQLAEKKNNPLAWYLLSMENNDLQLLRRAAEGGNVQALNAIGMISLQEALKRNDRGSISTNALEKIVSSAYTYFSQAAAKGDPNAYINLGTCYLRGFGCKTDLALAFTCFKAAAEAGHPEGMDYMSACYQFGHGVMKNDELSLYWAMRGRAARGDEAAARWLRERK